MRQEEGLLRTSPPFRLLRLHHGLAGSWDRGGGGEAEMGDATPHAFSRNVGAKKGGEMEGRGKKKYLYLVGTK